MNLYHFNSLLLMSGHLVLRKSNLNNSSSALLNGSIFVSTVPHLSEEAENKVKPMLQRLGNSNDVSWKQLQHFSFPLYLFAYINMKRNLGFTTREVRKSLA